jgi:cysteine synthase A
VSRPPLVSSIADLIGRTPALELRRLTEHLGLSGRLVAKLEYLSPGLSKKDRVARAMVETARQDGSLKPGQTVVELTSGNTGTGLAIVCQAFGHPFVAVMSTGNTEERARMMRAFGAEVVLVAQAPGSQPGQVSGTDLALVEERARALAAERGAFRADQFQLPSSADVHERTTGPELWGQSGEQLEGFVSFVGSGGSFTGVSRFLNSVSPSTRCYVVLPAQPEAHSIQGGGYGRTELPLLDTSLVHGYLTVTDDEARQFARLLARHEGVLAGISTGADCAAAASLLRGPLAGGRVAFLASDSGMKYLSTGLY